MSTPRARSSGWLAGSDDNQLRIVADGGLAPLARLLLLEQSEECQVNAAMALTNLAARSSTGAARRPLDVVVGRDELNIDPTVRVDAAEPS